MKITTISPIRLDGKDATPIKELKAYCQSDVDFVLYFYADTAGASETVQCMTSLNSGWPKNSLCQVAVFVEKSPPFSDGTPIYGYGHSHTQAFIDLMGKLGAV